MELQKLVTPKQWSVLEKNGIISLYELITHTPSRLHKLIWVENPSQLQDIQENEHAILVAYILGYSFIKGKVSGIKITLFTKEIGNITAFCFLPPKFIMHHLKHKDEVLKIIMKRSQNFWTITSLSKYTPGLDTETSEYVPVYHKQGLIDTRFMRAVTKRLQPHDFVLNFTGLIPQQLGIPTLISLEPLHKPRSEKKFMETQRIWNEIMLFLKLAEFKFFVSQQQSALAQASHITSAIEQKIITAHPYALSQSQKEVIHTYIGKISTKKDPK